MPPAVYVDGRAAAALPLPDRAAAYGDGLFETLLARGRCPAWLELHAERLRAGLAALGIGEPPWQQHLQAALTTLPDDRRWRTLRMTVTRGAGPRGYVPPPEARARTVIEIGDGTLDPLADPAPLRAAAARFRWSRQPALAGIKHLNRLEQVLAAKECRDRGYDELVVRDPEDAPVSTVSANLFLLRDGVLLTPALPGCGIRGTRRRLLLEVLGPALSLRCAEARLATADLETAEAVFCCNSVRGIVPLASCDDVRWRGSAQIPRLQNAYREALAACVV